MVRPKPQKVKKSTKSKNLPKAQPLSQVSSKVRTSGYMSAYANMVTNGNCLTCVGSKGVPKRLGMEGTRFVGSQFVTGVLTAAASNALFDGASGADLLTVNMLALDPDSLNGRLAAIATLYRQYQWKHIRIDYESASSTATAGAFALGIITSRAYTADGTGVEPTSFATVQDCNPSCVTPYYGNSRLDLQIDEEEPLMSTDATTSAATANLNYFYLTGWPNVTSSGATARGYLRITYVIDFYSPCPTQGLSFLERTFNRLSEEEKRELLARITGSGQTLPPPNRRDWDVMSATSSRK